MADLRNAQRISYKATYNQVSPKATIADTGTKDGGRDEGRDRKGRFRAMEKAAFVQALRIAPEELPFLKRRLAGRGQHTDADSLAAVEQLVSDQRPGSTVLNASRFSDITPSVLVDIAHALIDYREEAAAAINKSLAQILVAHREAHAPAPAPTTGEHAVPSHEVAAPPLRAGPASRSARRGSAAARGRSRRTRA